jgi:ElaB/YqjD/DUF883 family membrane-anchored ribosome-binding protein
MESNADNTFGSQSTGSSTTGGSFGATTGSQGGSQGSTGSTGSAGSSGGASIGGFTADDAKDAASNVADRARSAAGTASDKLADVGSTVRDRAGNLKSTIADALESGAERLRQQGAGGGQIAGASATGGSTGMIADTPQLGAAANQLAGGLQASADWLRDADIDGLKSSVERQVKEHPGRTLAVAVGLGYLLGKALRK